MGRIRHTDKMTLISIIRTKFCQTSIYTSIYEQCQPHIFFITPYLAWYGIHSENNFTIYEELMTHKLPQQTHSLHWLKASGVCSDRLNLFRTCTERILNRFHSPTLIIMAIITIFNSCAEFVTVRSKGFPEFRIFLTTFFRADFFLDYCHIGN